MCNLHRDLTNCKVGCVLIFIALIDLPQCESTTIRVAEGEKAQLDFPYPCNSTVVTLQHGYARPFYRSADPHYMSLSSNQDLVNYTKIGLDQCFLNLTVNPVSRADEDTYILTAYKNGAMLPDYSRIYLGVDYPPGKAWCERKSDYNDGKWVLLQCTAPVGTLPGHVVCYQNDMILPKWTEPHENFGDLNQVILARSDDVVYCCSSFLTGMKDMCDCKDWRWDPMTDSVFDIADPCPKVMSTEDPTSTHIINTDNLTSSSSYLVTAPTEYPKNNKNTPYWIVTGVFIVIFILTIITLGMKYHCKVREFEHQRGRIRPESQEPCSSLKEKEVLENYGSIIEADIIKNQASHSEIRT